MTAPEAFAIAAGNVWRMKARAALTVSGVAIGIGALVSMLAFSAGIQRNVSGEFQKLGLLETLHVMKAQEKGGAQARTLDQSAVTALEALPGVVSAYPQVSFDASLAGTSGSGSVTVQGLPAELVARRLPLPLVAGRTFERDDDAEIVVSSRWAERAGEEPAALLGRRVTLDATGLLETLIVLGASQLEHLGLRAAIIGRAREIALRVAERASPSTVTVTVVGVADLDGGFGLRRSDLLLPIGIASGIDHVSFSDPVEMLSIMLSPGGEGWRRVIVLLQRQDDADRVRDAIEAMGFKVFSFLDQFREIRRAFLIFNGLVAAIGLMALCIASLGIVNTMLMSILERTREIGVLKAVGGEEGEIRLLFLAEAGLIGLVGSVAGVLLGWVASRALSWGLLWWMESQGAPAVDLFTLTPTAAVGAVAFGIVISLVAGTYPAARAARIDPVRALRAE